MTAKYIKTKNIVENEKAFGLLKSWDTKINFVSHDFKGSKLNSGRNRYPET